MATDQKPATELPEQEQQTEAASQPGGGRISHPPFGRASGGGGMSGNDIGAGRVIAVLLADGWHRTVPGSFTVGPLGFGGAADLGVPGFRFEEADAGSPYQPTMLAGPLDSVIA